MYVYICTCCHIYVLLLLTTRLNFSQVYSIQHFAAPSHCNTLHVSFTKCETHMASPALAAIIDMDQQLRGHVYIGAHICQDSIVSGNVVTRYGIITLPSWSYQHVLRCSIMETSVVTNTPNPINVFTYLVSRFISIN